MKVADSIKIDLNEANNGLWLIIEARRPNSLFDAEENSAEINEARFQLVEGCYYDYEISDNNYLLGDIGQNIIQQHKRNSALGTIAPNIFVGTLTIPILNKFTLEELTTVELEVQSVKSGYRDDYRDMLELITEKCTDLLLQANSPVSQQLEIDYKQDSQTLYQRFAFINSIIGTDEFAEAIHRIVTAPVTKWTEIAESKDIRNARRFSNATIKEFLKGGNRTKLPGSHYLKNYGIETLPEKITSVRKTDSNDTPENRFVKHTLENFLKFCTEINSAAIKCGHKKLQKESDLLIYVLESQLHHSFFKDISRPSTLKLNSPVLQRKEGYREVLRVWLMFDLAAKLIWKGGDDIYGAGKKDIATLYEYWLFFKLLDLFQEVFDIRQEDISELIQPTTDGLSLQIKQGKSTPLKGEYDSESRKLNIRFNYNRSFRGNYNRSFSVMKNYPDSGSWTTTLRPDYTLSIWPLGVSEEEAEKQEIIVHVHFDAKYKVANLKDLLEENSEKELDEEKTENRKGIYKNADLLKMHAYKDAIRRTGGAYVLYPGDHSINKLGFHEIIPGLGAFAVKPSKKESGIGELKSFILEILHHFINRTTQREKIAFRTYDTYKNPPNLENDLREALPEAYNQNRGLMPDETFVLIGFYKSTEHYQWIMRRKLYNFRMDTRAGSLNLDKETVSSQYLLLHGPRDSDSGNLWRITSNGPKVWSKKTMVKNGYPGNNPQDYYLIIEIEKVTDPVFENTRWNFKNLNNYSGRRGSALPFTASLAELMRNKVK